jgi:hypothetical protein
MQAKRKRETRTYPQSAGNLALADESLAVLQRPKANTRSLVAGRGTGHYGEEYPAVDVLAPARGVMMGTGLSIMLWCPIIILVMYWIR